ncbi:HNH endonuclease family protein [Streptantibioticus parmotrematis]|uniref:HNH endonuclease family protein n=1 Tax=Streptantibioticus parmotrematis TaxID=2873249 RepID=UPI0027E1A9C9|nr:HNH endonuclease family protein [Streptantibioticus parmotrematis]
MTALGELRVSPEAPVRCYDRVKDFGPAWSDDTSAPGGHNGCDTRDDILRRDLTGIRLDGRCKVVSGTLDDPYTNRTIHVTRGRETSSAVRIDHMAALGDVWTTGAANLTQAQREELANDPLNLDAVDGAANDDEGDDDASRWLPPATGYRCEYVARQIAVKVKYRLWVTPSQKSAMNKVLATCPSQPLPTGSSPEVALRS